MTVGRPRRYSWRIAAATLALLLAPSRGAAPQDSPTAPEEPTRDSRRERVERYVAAAEAYRDGGITHPLQGLSQWSLIQLEEVVRQFERQGRDRVRGVIRQLESAGSGVGPAIVGWCPTAEDIGSRRAEAAILLHTDAVVAALVTDSPVEAERNLRYAESLVVSLDAWLEMLRTHTRLPEGCEVRESVPRREWYVTMARALAWVGDPGAADALLRRGMRALEADGSALFVAGAVKESVAAMLARLDQPDKQSEAQLEAERLYRRALALEPRRVEARLRLGRVLCEAGRCREAEPYLVEALETSHDPSCRYLAALHLGRAREIQGRFDGAIAAYRLASTERPHAQTARLALAHALQRKGDAAAARALIEAALAEPWHVPGAATIADPWGVYYLGPSSSVDALLNQMRTRLRIPE